MRRHSARARLRRTYAVLAGVLWLLGIEVLPNLHLATHDEDRPHTHAVDGTVITVTFDRDAHRHADGTVHSHAPRDASAPSEQIRAGFSQKLDTEKGRTQGIDSNESRVVSSSACSPTKSDSIDRSRTIAETDGRVRTVRAASDAREGASERARTTRDQPTGARTTREHRERAGASERARTTRDQTTRDQTTRDQTTRDQTTRYQTTRDRTAARDRRSPVGVLAIEHAPDTHTAAGLAHRATAIHDAPPLVLDAVPVDRAELVSRYPRTGRDAVALIATCDARGPPSA